MLVITKGKMICHGDVPVAIEKSIAMFDCSKIQQLKCLVIIWITKMEMDSK